jgi:hypothetical protein
MIGTLLRLIKILKVLTWRVRIRELIGYLHKIDTNGNGEICLLEIAEELLKQTGAKLFGKKDTEN